MTDPATDADDDAELSGLLDGELDPLRATRLRQRIAAEPALRARWVALQVEEARWRAMAGSAQAPMAMPALASGAERAAVPARWVGALVLALTVGRLLPKVLPLDLVTAFVLHGVLLGLGLAVVVIGSRRLPSLAA